MLNKKEYPNLTEEHFMCVRGLANEPEYHSDYPGVNYRLYRMTQEVRKQLKKNPDFDYIQFKRAVERQTKLNRAFWRFILKGGTRESLKFNH